MIQLFWLFFPVLLVWGAVSALGQGTGTRGDETHQELIERMREESKARQMEQLQKETPEARILRLKRELLEAELAALGATKVEVEGGEGSDMPSGALVIVSADQSEGSGFIGALKEHVFFITNIHVLGGARGSSITTADGVPVRLGNVAFLSRKRDIAIVPITWTGPVLDISASLHFDEVGIGQSVTVMGDSHRNRVAMHLKGKILGIGPGEIEVSAQFLARNSGSPIMHDELGSVIGVVSYMRSLSVNSNSKWKRNSGFTNVRRFGYRLDGDIEWERVSLSELYRQAEVYHRFEDRTEVMRKIAYMLVNESQLMTGYRDHESLGYLFDKIDRGFSWRRGTNSANNQRILRRFLSGMMTELQNDRKDTIDALEIDFYRHRYYEIEGTRDQVRYDLERLKKTQLQ